MTPLLLLALGPAVGWGGAIMTPQQSLEPAAERFAQAWIEGDMGGLAELLRRAGIRLHLQGEDHLALPPRQVQAALRSFKDRYQPGEVTVTRVSLAEGDSSQGFADLVWRTGARGGGGVVTFTLFVAFAQEEGTWMITELRILSS